MTYPAMVWQRRPRGWRAQLDGWSIDLVRRRRLLQLASPRIGGRQRTRRSVFEYAMQVDGAWAGGWHGRERQTAVTVSGASITRHSVLDDFAEATVEYRIADDGLHVAHEIRWLRDVTVGRYYTAMFPLGEAFRPDQANRSEPKPGSIVCLEAPGARAGLEIIEGQGDLLVWVRTKGLVKIYATWSDDDGPERVPAGARHRGHVRYFASVAGGTGGRLAAPDRPSTD